jgi:DNA-binding LacI/PurR family transcriptional regulator
MNVFAFIAPELQSGMYPSFLHGYHQACANRQHQTMVGSSGNDVGRQADLLMQMIVQAIGGIAIVPTTMPETPPHQIKLLQQSQIPVVMCHRGVQGVATPSVVYNGREMGLLAGEYLRDQGHRRITVLFMHRYSMACEYERGMRDAFESVGLSSDGITAVEYAVDPTIRHPRATESLQRTIASLLAQVDRPTAVFCGNAHDAEIVYLQATSMGLSIPGDLSLICVNSTLRGHGLASRISTVAVDECELGKKAAELLHEMRTGKRALDNEERIEFRASLLPGETIAPPSANVN